MWTYILLVGCLGSRPAEPTGPEDACARGLGAECGKLAKSAQDAQDLQSAREYGKKGCRLNDGESCAIVSEVAWELGERGEATWHARLACDLEYWKACNSLGAMLSLTGEYEEVEAALVRGCDGGFAKACTNLGHHKYSGDPSAQDVPGAMESWRRGCDGADGEGCLQIATLLATGRYGVTRDPSSAAGYLTKACEELQFGAACAELGQAYAPGGFLETDAARAEQFHAKACSLGASLSCR